MAGARAKRWTADDPADTGPADRNEVQHESAGRQEDRPTGASISAVLALRAATPWLAGVLICHGLPGILVAGRTAGPLVTAVVFVGLFLIALAIRRPVSEAVRAAHAAPRAAARIIHLREPGLTIADYQRAATAHGDIDGAAERIGALADDRQVELAWSHDSAVGRGRRD